MKVSVLVVTHDHAAFIDQALASVYGQEADFEFEVLISEDASTDGTRDIVRDWHNRHPDRTRLLLSERNVRSNQVVRRGFAAARGEYIALLDGDDYWTSPSKLRRQVTCLDSDPSLSLCFHNAHIVGGEPGPFNGVWTSPELKPRLSLADLWNGNPFATCTSMFRRASRPDIPDCYDDFFPVTDWPLYVLFAERGDIRFLPEVMGAYRIHKGGLFSSKSEEEKLASMDRLYRRLNDCLDGRHDDAIRAGHCRYFLDWAKAHLRNGRISLARTSLGHARAYRGPWKASERLETTLVAARVLLASMAPVR